MKKLMMLLALVSACTVIYAQTKLSAAEITAFTSRVAAESKKVKTLQADFVQTKKMDFLNKDIVSAGKMALQAPNLLSWRYSKPYSYSVVFKNSKIYIDNQGKKSAVDAKSKNFEKINKLIAGSANGNLFNDPEFNVQYLKNRGFTVARFTPKSSQLLKYIRQVDLYFADNQSSVSQVRMLEASGDTTQIVFKNIKINAALPASAFTL